MISNAWTQLQTLIRSATRLGFALPHGLSLGQLQACILPRRNISRPVCNGINWLFQHHHAIKFIRPLQSRNDYWKPTSITNSVNSSAKSFNSSCISFGPRFDPNLPSYPKPACWKAKVFLPYKSSLTGTTEQPLLKVHQDITRNKWPPEDRDRNSSGWK